MSNEPDISKYSASSSLIGYIYQCRLALLEALKRLHKNPKLTVAIETLDDVVFLDEGKPEEIIQVKHHISRQANLSDASSDMWKTMRIWMDMYGDDLTKDGAVLCMMTTASAAENSAAFYLRVDERDEEKAEQYLLNTARTSTNKENKPIYDSFKALTPEDRRDLLNAVVIHDSCPLNDDLDECLEEQFWLACQRNQVSDFRTYYEGWWLGRVLKSFRAGDGKPILGEEIYGYLDQLREEFKADTLPIYPTLKTAKVDHSSYMERTFTRQLQLIGVGEGRVKAAVNNYYRAFEQRSRWSREELVLVGDLEEYEDKLMEEWTVRFEAMREDLGEAAADAEKVKLARELYQWIETEANTPIRPRCHEPFITRGSYQMLADRQKVGWHPEFKDMLQQVLQKAEV
jgi:hypothetical protein